MKNTVDKILTVSIAAYNVEKYLSQALESCVSAIDGLDVIVVNDGSKDGTLEVANEWASRYPESIRVVDKPNAGYGSTINAAIPLARGRYFRFLDGDDWFDPEALCEYVELLSRSSEDAIITPYVRVYESGDEPELRDCVDYLGAGMHIASELRPDQAVAACSVTYRTDILVGSSFEMTERCFYTDIEYAYLPMRFVKNLFVARLPIYQYRIGREGQSVSVEGIRRHHADIVRVRARLLRELGDVDCVVGAYLKGCLVKECAVVYRFLCISGPDESVKKELREFDALLKAEAPEVYRLTGEKSKLVFLLRKSRFLAWGLACRRVQGRA